MFVHYPAVGDKSAIISICQQSANFNYMALEIETTAAKNQGMIPSVDLEILVAKNC
jgi:hypothetical protein